MIPPAQPQTVGPQHRWDRGVGLMVTRTAWLAIVLFTIGVFVIAIPARWEQLRYVSPQAVTRVGQLGLADLHALQQLGLTSDFYATLLTMIEALTATVFALIAFVIVWRKSADGVALFIALSLILMGTVGTPAMSALPHLEPAWSPAIWFLRMLHWQCFILFFYLFPTGRFVPRWTRWLALGWAAYTVAVLFFPAIAPPVAIVDFTTPTDILVMVWILFWLATAVFAQSYRYRHVSGLKERQQTKWIVWGIAAACTSIGVFVGPQLIFPALVESRVIYMVYKLVGIVGILLCVSLLPITIGIAVLRYHLLDIDIIIRRTLIYGVLTVLLAAVYFASVIVLQQILAPLIGGNDQLTIVASTLAIAALFHPLRRRTQNIIDRRLYRQKYDAQQTVQAFSARLRDETDLDQLSSEIVQLVEDTLRPAHVSLWLREDNVRSRKQWSEMS